MYLYLNSLVGRLLLLDPWEVFPGELLKPSIGMGGAGHLEGCQLVGGVQPHPLDDLPLTVNPRAQEVALGRWGISHTLPAFWQLDSTITILPSYNCTFSTPHTLKSKYCLCVQPAVRCVQSIMQCAVCSVQCVGLS